MRRSIVAAVLSVCSTASLVFGVTAASATVTTQPWPSVRPLPYTQPLPYALPKAGDSLTSVCSTAFYDGDYRLGPADLPQDGLVGFELIGYQRTGSLTPGQLLAQYYNTTTRSWIYPPDNGYVVVNGSPLVSQLTLQPGQDIDRYGSEYGSFLAPEGLPYAARSIPPQSLDGNPAAGCNYHDYRVLRPFDVDAGPIAPWFGQPGYGLQYQLDASLMPGGPTTVNVGWLVAHGYLERLV